MKFETDGLVADTKNIISLRKDSEHASEDLREFIERTDGLICGERIYFISLSLGFPQGSGIITKKIEYVNLEERDKAYDGILNLIKKEEDIVRF